MDQQWQQKTMYGTLKSTDGTRKCTDGQQSNDGKKFTGSKSLQMAIKIHKLPTKFHIQQEVHRWHKKIHKLPTKLSHMARSLQMARSPQVARSPQMAHKIHKLPTKFHTWQEVYRWQEVHRQQEVHRWHIKPTNGTAKCSEKSTDDTQTSTDVTNLCT